jgi:alkanesulfonate monooxygenase SsuD/methylene tetrahydromethanopterin reductase-like flavin-dependent oxidoreductase (luciferase family)
MDYGHDLLFGSFVTPVSGAPHNAVALAQISERAGLDLVSFQDHPYQAAFLDTWTLLSYTAALTESIRLTPNVLNVPLRQPAVVARSAASLDLLSGGRVELALGAGAFWDAIEAMGARRLTPAQSIRALEEAIAVMRGIWAADDASMLRVDGEFHRVHGAKRGPAPAHDIDIWVGAYKPRMLRLIGRLADGWLPSLGYLQPGDLARSNGIIDEAAAAEGRDPAQIRRLLNIGPGSTPDELAEFALDDGISAFILGSDDPDELERFGHEIAPEVRAIVAAERAERGAQRKAPEQASAAASVPERLETGADALGLTPTPDPGVRLAAEPAWDESTRPHRAQRPAGTEYTDTGRAVGQHLIDVHDHLRTELTRLRSLIEQVRAGTLQAAQARSEINDMTMRQNDWTLGAFCASYCRLVAGHHGLEDDAIFPHLRERDPGLAPVIDRLEEEHRTIHDVLERIDRALVQFIADPEDFSGLQAAVDMLTDTLLSHLSYEEFEIVEPLARLGFYPGQV